MTAREARALALHAEKTAPNLDAYTRVMLHVRGQSEQGESSCKLLFMLPEAVITRLRADGYRVFYNGSIQFVGNKVGEDET